MGTSYAGRWLVAATFLAAISGLVYELIAGTASSYLLGNSVYHFSIVIGLFMFAMGLGAYLARHVQFPATGFVLTQLTLSALGGTAALLLYVTYGLGGPVDGILYILCLVLGTLIGLEVPLVLDLLRAENKTRLKISDVLSADYLGALIAALAFPLLLLPQLGLVAAGALMGLLNFFVGLITAFRLGVWRQGTVLSLSVLALVVLGGTLIFGNSMVRSAEARAYQHEVIFAKSTPYQRILVTQDSNPPRLRLFLNDALQFDSLDEYRYHEALIWPALSRHPAPERVAVLGGGDGLAVRQLLKDPRVVSIDLVDLDPAVSELFATHPELITLNQGALLDPKVTIYTLDAWHFLEESPPLTYDLVVIDLPDPRSLEIARLYTDTFYAMAADKLRGGGIMVTQATSPAFSPEAFWTIAASMSAGTGNQARPYQAYVPSFGMWGFVMAGDRLPEMPRWAPDVSLRFFDPKISHSWFDLPPDVQKLSEQDVHSLSDFRLPALYEAAWGCWYD